MRRWLPLRRHWRAKTRWDLILWRQGLIDSAAITLSDTLTLGDLIVGVGTLALAAFTAWLGFSTRAAARASRAAVEAFEEPFVIAAPTDDIKKMKPTRLESQQLRGPTPPFEIHRTGEAGAHFVRLKLWNIGSGPAIVQDVALTHGNERFLDGLAHFQPIGAGQAADIEVGSSAWPVSSRIAALTINYTRASGVAYRTTQEVVIDDPLVLTKTYSRERLDKPVHRVL